MRLLILLVTALSCGYAATEQCENHDDARCRTTCKWFEEEKTNTANDLCNQGSKCCQLSQPCQRTEEHYPAGTCRENNQCQDDEKSPKIPKPIGIKGWCKGKKLKCCVKRCTLTAGGLCRDNNQCAPNEVTPNNLTPSIALPSGVTDWCIGSGKRCCVATQACERQGESYPSGTCRENNQCLGDERGPSINLPDGVNGWCTGSGLKCCVDEPQPCERSTDTGYPGGVCREKLSSEENACLEGEGSPKIEKPDYLKGWCIGSGKKCCVANGGH